MCVCVAKFVVTSNVYYINDLYLSIIFILKLNWCRETKIICLLYLSINQYTLPTTALNISNNKIINVFMSSQKNNDKVI